MFSVTAIKKRKKPERILHSRSLWTRILTALAFMTVIVCFYPHRQLTYYKYEQGRPWNYAKLIAPFDVPVHPDSVTLKNTVDSLTAVFVPVYRHVPVDIDSVTRIVISRMEDYGAAKAADADSRAGRRQFYGKLSIYLANVYGRGVIVDSLPASLGTRHKSGARILDKNVLRTTPVSSFVTRSDVLAAVDSLAAVCGQTAALQNVGIGTLLQPSVICDEAESNRLLNNEKSLVAIDRGVIQRGQTIIDKGAVITPQDYTNIRTYETLLHRQSSQTTRSEMLMLCGQCLYVLLLFAAMLSYLYIYEHDSIWNDMRAYLYVLTLCTAFFLVTVALDTRLSFGLYIVPLAIVPVLVQVFYNGRAAMFAGFFVAMLIAGIASSPLEFVFMQFAAVSAVVLSMRDISQRSELLRSSFFVGVAYCVSYCALHLMSGGSFADLSLRVLLLLVINAALTGLAYILMFAVERLFGFVSSITLVELTDTNNPLLRELSDECPGTFQHSVAVATLATDGARAIGANELLTRAGAMYHDIGKVGNPIFFTENQHGVNPHDGLTPERSAEIIIGHVAEGLRRAEAARLPAVIRDFISQHHGRGRAKYFYVTACNSTDGEVDPEPFTYPGPNPQSRETSVMMMADAVEATSRSLTEHTPQAISALVDRIVDGQIADGLHNESSLRFNDVPRIKEAFVKRLKTMYHTRVVYPSERKNTETASTDTATDNKQ